MPLAPRPLLSHCPPRVVPARRPLPGPSRLRLRRTLPGGKLSEEQKAAILAAEMRLTAAERLALGAPLDPAKDAAEQFMRGALQPRAKNTAAGAAAAASADGA